jgi:hypothetical protein
VVFSGTPVSSTNKTDRHDITEILLKVALNTINPNPLDNESTQLAFNISQRETKELHCPVSANHKSKK